MFSIARLAKSSSLVQVRQIQRALLSTSLVRRDAEDENLQRGPYPRTKEERDRAARKYNLIPEDYEPYDEGEAWGDYPKLKAIGNFNRDRYDDFDDPSGHRFYGEVLHRDDDYYFWERIDPLAHEKDPVPDWQKLGLFLSFFAFTFGFYLFCKKFKIEFNHDRKKRWNHPHDQKYYEFPKSASHH